MATQLTDQDSDAQMGALERITMRLWNYMADEYNQWDALGQDERDTLMEVARGEIGPDVTDEGRGIPRLSPSDCSQEVTR